MSILIYVLGLFSKTIDENKKPPHIVMDSKCKFGR